METFLTQIREYLDAHASHLRSLFEVMAGEAIFARAWLDEDVKRLPKGAAILEVGGGVFLLTCQLAREGFAITAIEPTGVGFGAFEELGEIVLKLAKAEGAAPTIARCKAEDFASESRFAFAFSVNVMEHIDAPDVAIARVSAVLAAGGSYRFLCPNYLFPYEPHFNIPTFGSKALTEKLMRARIYGNKVMDDPQGLWQSLNWIDVLKVRAFAAADDSLVLTFNKRTLAWMLARALSDEGFAKRRARWMVAGIRLLSTMGVLKLVAWVPALLQPIMDVRLTKRL
jgi:SAM-dependent methyltransferase